MSKYVIQYKQGCDTITEALGISQGRADELQFRTDLIVHELFRPTKSGLIKVDSDTIIKQFLSLAENHAESLWLAFCAGMCVESLLLNDDEDGE